MLGIIGGTGLYKLDGFLESESLVVETPFGSPSAPLTIGKLEGAPVAFLPRHGTQHQILPSEVNYRANIWALKKIGVGRILGISAVGSLTEEIRPGDFAVPDQYIDFTRGRRALSFFGNGLVGHISSAEPVCSDLSGALKKAVGILGKIPHAHAVYACVEGPRLGTRAESRMLQYFGATIVGMTNVPEVFLAREAQICYASLAIATDYDSWLDDPSQHASTPAILETYKLNLGRVMEAIPKLISLLGGDRQCACAESLKYAVLTDSAKLTEDQRELVALLRS